MFDFTTLNEITLKLKDEIKKSLSQTPTVYELWFNELTVHKMTDRILFVSVHTDMQKLTIETKYMHLITDAIKTIYFGLDLKVVVYCTMYGKVTKEQMDFDEKKILLEDIDDDAISNAAKKTASNSYTPLS